MSDILKTFFTDVGKSKLLTHEEEISLSKLIESGDRRARNRMINSNIRLAISIAKKYQNKGCSLEDLIQESNIGLMKAVDRFDWRRGFKFSTYACWWIKQSIRRHIASQANSIRLPSYARGMLWKLKQTTEEYEKEFGTKPSVEELADLLGVTLEALKAITTCASTPISLHAPVGSAGDGSRMVLDTIPDKDAVSVDTVLDKQKIVESIRGAFYNLSPREEKIIRLRFGISESTDSDAAKYSITTNEITQLNERAKKEAQ